MKFIQFIKYIPKIVNHELPAVSAQLKMAPAERTASMDPDVYMKNGPRLSAVMMLFYPKAGDTHLVLTKRNEYAGIHSAQISFPGGKAEPGDNDLVQTALRETFEETGIEQSEIDVIMPFTPLYIPPSNFLVSPFLGLAHSELEFIPNAYEVREIIEVPLEVLLDDAIVVTVEMQTSYSQKTAVPAFKIQDHLVWGATAMILSELKETINFVLK